MEDYELYKAVHGWTMMPKILPYSRVEWDGQVVKITIIAYDEENENHIIVGFQPSDELAETLDQCDWSNTGDYNG